MRPMHTRTTPKMFTTQRNENETPRRKSGAKRLLMGLVMAVAMMFLHHDASAGGRTLNVIFRLDMVNSGVDENASGKISGMPLPNVLDPISHIHQLDVVKDGNVLLTGAIGSDMQSDCTAPTVILTVPANGDTGVAVNQAIAATFNEPMNPLTINRTTFTLKQGR